MAIEDITDAIADQAMPPWCAGDEVYGRSNQLRQHLDDHQIGYVRLAVPTHAQAAAPAAPRHPPSAPMPTQPDQPPPPEPGLIPLTVAEIKRLFNLITRRHLPEHHHR